MTFSRRRFLHLTTAAAVFAPRIVSAQAYPARAVRVIVPYAPAGPTDVFARLMAQKLSEQLGAQFYVENIAGAGGNIGIGRAAQSSADGYTILVTGANLVVNPALYPHVPYDPAKNFDPVTLAVTAPAVLTVNPALPVQTVKDLVALIKAHPGKYSFASPGTRLGGRGTYADFFRLDGAGSAAGQGRKAAGARGLEQEALAAAPRRTHHGGSRLSRSRGRIVVCRRRAVWNAQGDHCAAPARNH